MTYRLSSSVILVTQKSKKKNSKVPNSKNSKFQSHNFSDFSLHAISTTALKWLDIHHYIKMAYVYIICPHQSRCIRPHSNAILDCWAIHTCEIKHRNESKIVSWSFQTLWCELYQRFVSHVRGTEVKQFRRWLAKTVLVLFHCFISHHVWVALSIAVVFSRASVNSNSKKNKLKLKRPMQ